MNKFFAILFVASLLSGCKALNYTITGTLDAAPGDSIYLLAQYQTSLVLASGTVGADSSFVLKGRVADPMLAVLKIGGEQTSIVSDIFLEPGELSVTITDYRPIVSGTPLNDSLKTLTEKMQILRDRCLGMTSGVSDEESDAIRMQMDRLPLDMAQTNKENLLGAYLLERYEFPDVVKNPDSTRIATMKARLDQFPATLQNNQVVLLLRENLAAVEKIRIGKPYLDLSGEDVSGNTVMLSSLVGSGKWVLIDFWATWCVPCMQEMPYLREAYAAYRDKGFEIYGVSLDNDTQRWRSYVTENEMPWVNVLSVDSEKQSVSAALYMIRSIPSNFLISPEGVIIAKQLRGKRLQEELAKYIH